MFIPTNRMETILNPIGRRYIYRAAVGRSRLGRFASPAATRAISPPINWNMASVAEVLNVPLSVKISLQDRQPHQTARNLPPVPGIATDAGSKPTESVDLKNPVELKPGDISYS